MSNTPDKLLAQLAVSDQSTPPKHQSPQLWNPPLSGQMDLVIKKNGDWVHEGVVIERKQLIRLFASILRKEGEEYFLVTPAEKWQIRVEDAPLQVVSVKKVVERGYPALVFETATGDTVTACTKNRISVTICDKTGEPSPYLLIHNGLLGRLSRSVFYQLADWAIERNQQGTTIYGVESMGEFFPLNS